MAYSVGYAGKDMNGTLYRSRDGKSWRPLLQDFFAGGGGNEVGLAFAPDNSAHALVRGALRQDGAPRPCTPMFYTGAAPRYQEWRRRHVAIDWDGDGTIRPAEDILRAPFGGPQLLRLRDGRLLAVGRVLGPGDDDGHISVFTVDTESAVLTRLADLDGTTYGGICEHAGKLWVSYGDSGTTAIFLAELALPQ
jgi:hypothetical protein